MKYFSITLAWVITVCMLVVVLWWSSVGVTSGSQTKYLTINNAHTCEAGAQMAKEDFNKGSYFVLHYGIPEEATILTGHVLKEEYGIETFYGGCTGGPVPAECYAFTMDSLILQKYGQDLYKVAHYKADSILRTTKE